MLQNAVGGKNSWLQRIAYTHLWLLCILSRTHIPYCGYIEYIQFIILVDPVQEESLGIHTHCHWRSVTWILKKIKDGRSLRDSRAVILISSVWGFIFFFLIYKFSFWYQILHPLCFVFIRLVHSTLMILLWRIWFSYCPQNDSPPVNGKGKQIVDCMLVLII